MMQPWGDKVPPAEAQVVSVRRQPGFRKSLEETG